MEEENHLESLNNLPLIPLFPQAYPPNIRHIFTFTQRMYHLNSIRGEYMIHKAECYRLKREMETWMILTIGEIPFEVYLECHFQIKRIESAVIEIEHSLRQIDLELETLDQLSKVELNMFV